MFLSPRAPLKPLAELCRRMNTSIEAGIDVRTVLARETDRAHGPLQHHLQTISRAINQGQSMADGLEDTGDFFPPLFRAMVAMGEQTGTLDRVLAQLTNHYDNQIQMRRIFLASILWPMIQLAIAIMVVGFLIWITGFIRETTHDKNIDMLGFGLVGSRGLMIYAALLGCAAVVVAFVFQALRRGLVWTQPIQRFMLQIPVLGRSLQTIALARLAWSMNITLNSGMDVCRAMQLSLESTQNARYTDQIPAINGEIMAGHSIHEAFRRAGGYPIEFLDSLAVGEESGRVVESMGVLAPPVSGSGQGGAVGLRRTCRLGRLGRRRRTHYYANIPVVFLLLAGDWSLTMVRTFLVTGAAGFIGSHIAEALVARGDRVRVLDNLSTGHLTNLAAFRDRIEFIEGDATDSKAVAKAVEGVDCVFHEAALASVPLSVERPLDSHAACATGVVTVLDAARRAGVRRVVYAASSAAYGDQPTSSKRETDLPNPLSPYAAGKLAGELYCQAFWSSYGFGNRGDSLFQRVRPAPRPAQPILGGDSIVHHVDVGGPSAGDLRRRPSVARFLVRGERGSRESSGGRCAERRRTHDQPAADGRSIDLLTLLDMLNRLLGTNVKPQFSPARAGDVRESQADITLARKLLAYEPQVDFEEGLRRSIAYYKTIAG